MEDRCAGIRTGPTVAQNQDILVMCLTNGPTVGPRGCLSSSMNVGVWRGSLHCAIVVSGGGTHVGADVGFEGDVLGW